MMGLALKTKAEAIRASAQMTAQSTSVVVVFRLPVIMVRLYSHFLVPSRLRHLAAGAKSRQVALPSICPASFRDRFHLSAVGVYQAQSAQAVTKNRLMR
jgi:hypothetical protein